MHRVPRAHGQWEGKVPALVPKAVAVEVALAAAAARAAEAVPSHNETEGEAAGEGGPPKVGADSRLRRQRKMSRPRRGRGSKEGI